MASLFEKVQKKQQQSGEQPNTLFDRVAAKQNAQRGIRTPGRAAQSTPEGAYIPSAPQTQRGVLQSRVPESGRGTEVVVPRTVAEVDRQARESQQRESAQLAERLGDTEIRAPRPGEVREEARGAKLLRSLEESGAPDFVRGGAQALRRGLFGDERRQITGVGFGRETGLFPSLFPTLQRTGARGDEVRFEERRRNLAEAGVEEEEASRLAAEDIRSTLGESRVAQREDITPKAREALESAAFWERFDLALDVPIPIGATGRIGANVAKRLAKSVDDAEILPEVRKFITDEDTAQKVTQAIKQTDDPRVVEKAIQRGQAKAATPSPRETTEDVPQELAEEARKFDTAEEFVEAQPKVFYGTAGDFDTIQSMKSLRRAGTKVEPSNIGGNSPFVHVTTDKNLANKFASARSRNMGGAPNVREFAIQGKILDKTGDNTVSFSTFERGGDDILKEMREGGFVGVKFVDKDPVGRNVTTLAVLPDALKTRSQLTDIFNRAKRGEGAQRTGVEPRQDVTPQQAVDDIQQQTTGRREQQAPAQQQRELRPRGAAAERLDMPTSKQPLSEKEIVKRRRAFVRDLRDRFGLTDSQLRKISNNQDVRLMSNYGFKRFIDNMEQKAIEVADTRQAKAELMDVLERKRFERVDQYRIAVQGLPPVSQMNAQQLRQYTEALEQFQEGDEFLTQRTLEVIDRTDLRGVRTTREVKQKLLEEMNRVTGKQYTLKQLEDSVQFGDIDKWLNRFRYDTQLAESNPFLELVVKRTQAKQIEGQANFLRIQEKVNTLAKAARKSRSRGVVGNIKQRLIPRYNEIIAYLEAPQEQKTALLQQLTPEEIEYANFVSQYYTDAYEHLVSIKEIFGSRYVDQYFTHTRKTFLEEWDDNGLLSAFKNYWQQHKDDQVIANIIDQDTGQILPKAKFFQFTLQRTGTLDPSRNLTRVFLQYANTFERKKMFDAMIPEIDTYTKSLLPRDTTSRGLTVNRELETFINKYLNNKKGRRENFGGFLAQSGKVDIAVRLSNTFLSLMDIGLNIFASTASVVGETVMTYQALGKIGMAQGIKRRLWDTGLRRMKTQGGKSILKEAEPFIGRNVWTDIMDADQQFGDRAMKAIFSPFAQSTVEANKIFLLGSITKDELRAGKLSAERLAELRLEAGRWRDMGSEVKGIFGSTSIGGAVNKYKGWAIPIMATNIRNLTRTAARLRRREFKEAVTSREAAEIYRAIEISTVLVLVGSYVMAQEEDDTFVGKLKQRAYQEALTLLGGSDPTLFTSPIRLASFADNLAENVVQIARLEQYQQNSQWGQRGDLKGVRGLQRQFTPRVIDQFDDFGGNGSPETLRVPETDTGGGLKIPELKSGSGALKIPELR